MAALPLRLHLARASLVIVWLATAVVSVIGGEGEALLSMAGVAAGWHAPLIAAGAALDAVLGLALWRWHRRWIYILCALNMIVMTLVATVLLPDLWLDPLGRLLKNLPIATLLYVLHEDASA